MTVRGRFRGANLFGDLEVDGQVERKGDLVSVKAKKVRLAGRESDTSCAEEARR